MQSATIDQRVGGQDRSRQNTGRRRERKDQRESEGEIPSKGQREKKKLTEKKWVKRGKAIKEKHRTLKTAPTHTQKKIKTDCLTC